MARELFTVRTKPHQVLILDNATFHKGGRIADILAQAKFELWYLPPYLT
ncbi:transposase [[Leptolyngbya] sp. PCC 7376]